jgi:uncharacterized SAM-binding protein YcdF (DUF218 family)
MFFILSKVLRFLLTPISWIIILTVLAVWKKKRIYSYLSVGFLLFFTNPFIPKQLLKAWEVDPVSIEGRTFDLAIVLTGMTHTTIQVPGQIQLAEGADRIIETVKLYRKGQVKKILITGGSGSLTHPEFKESPSLKVLATSMGVSEQDIIVESDSRNTYENAKFTKNLIEQAPSISGDLLLVTSAFHMRRSIGCFEKQELTFTPYPVDYYVSDLVDYGDFIPSSGALEHWDRLLSEVIGTIAYHLAGYL